MRPSYVGQLTFWLMDNEITGRCLLYKGGALIERHLIGKSVGNV